MFTCPATDDFFRSRIDQMIDLRHPLAVLSSRMPWQEIEARVAHLLVRKAHAGQAMPDLDLFGEKPQRQAAASKAGRPRVALRIMVSLLYTSSTRSTSPMKVSLTAGARRRPGSSSQARRTLNTSVPATPPPWSSSASCSAKKAWKNFWHRRSTWRLRSS